jgi:hypothetical protein
MRTLIPEKAPNQTVGSVSVLTSLESIARLSYQGWDEVGVQTKTIQYLRVTSFSGFFEGELLSESNLLRWYF